MTTGSRFRVPHGKGAKRAQVVAATALAIAGAFSLSLLVQYSSGSTAPSTAVAAALGSQGKDLRRFLTSALQQVSLDAGGGSGAAAATSSDAAAPRAAAAPLSSDAGPRERFWHAVRSRIAEPDPGIVAKRCGGTKGDWCGRYDAQTPVPALPPPAGNRSCLWGCNFVGVCDAAKGWCRCPAGWTGDDCGTRMKRPCSLQHRGEGMEPFSKLLPLSVAGTTHACADQCDEDTGQCYCNATFAHGRVPADVALPPGSRPERWGRPMNLHCRRNKDWDGKTDVAFGSWSLEDLYGEQGWCQADRPAKRCACIIDGFGGEFCDIPHESFCPNQCNGHGECRSGYCKCDEGWYGHDCAYRTKGTPWTPGLEEGTHKWLKGTVQTPAARDPKPGDTRKRPLIYVYELPSVYNSNLLQYRIDKGSCVHRKFNVANVTELSFDNLYNVESGLHELLLQSEHRTLDPEEADYFYLPVYMTCMIYPVLGAGDFPYFHGGPRALRTHSATNMLIEVHNWIRTRYPYWDRNGGRDHIILSAHDEGSCWIPAVLRPAIVLSHWGRTELDHISGTGYWPDNYTADSQHPVFQPEGHVGKLGHFPCYNASKDMVIPPMFPPRKYGESPILGNKPKPRHLLGFFKGRMQHNNLPYSRGIRQFLHNTSREQDWWGKHKIWISDNEFPPGEEKSYSKMLSSSKFCLAIMGDGWSSRFEDGIMHGCIPVIIMDGVEVAWSSLLDVDSFSIRVLQKDLARLPEILKAVPPERVRSLQEGIEKVWRRYMWTTGLFGEQARELLTSRGLGGAWEKKQEPAAAKEEAQEPAAAKEEAAKKEEQPKAEALEAGAAEGPAATAARRLMQQQGRARSRGGWRLEAEDAADMADLRPAVPAPYDPAEDDAFSTLIQWLYSRVDDLGAHAPTGSTR